MRRREETKGRWPAWIDPDSPELNPKPNAVRMVEFRGQRRELRELAAEHGLPKNLVRFRLDSAGWPLEAALTLPKGAKYTGPRFVLEATPDPTPKVGMVSPPEPTGGRPVPKLKQHPLGQACVSFKVRGSRRWTYFGRWGSPVARRRYAAFVAAWPAPLAEEPPKRGKWSEPRLITHDGQTRTLAAWAKLYGLKPTTLRNRLDVEKWSMTRALTTPVKPWNRRTRKVPSAVSESSSARLSS